VVGRELSSSDDPAGAQPAAYHPAAVRERAHEMLAPRRGRRLDALDRRAASDRLPETARYVAAVIRDQYPTLAVPFHARWRHFASRRHRPLGAGRENARAWQGRASPAPSSTCAIVSVLLDAGSGPEWKYQTQHRPHPRPLRGPGHRLPAMFEAGVFSSPSRNRWRVDAPALIPWPPNAGAHAFQVSDRNPLVGLEGRAALLRNLGQACLKAGPTCSRRTMPRPGGLYDYPARPCRRRTPARPAILERRARSLGPVWPTAHLGGVEPRRLLAASRDERDDADRRGSSRSTSCPSGSAIRWSNHCRPPASR
jgi:hypothetical protein